MFRVDEPSVAASAAVAQKIKDAVLAQLQRRRMARFLDGSGIDARKKVLLLVNPKSGPGKALKILKSECDSPQAIERTIHGWPV